MSGGPGVIRNPAGERLDYTFAAGDGQPGGAVPPITVVLGHGVTAHKDRPWLVALSAALARAGLASLRLSFAGNGASEGRYEDSNPTKEVDDLRSVIDALGRWGVGRRSRMACAIARAQPESAAKCATACCKRSLMTAESSKRRASWRRARGSTLAASIR